MKLRKFKVQHDDLFWEMEVEIDECLAGPVIKEMVEFWTDWELHLDDADGDYTTAFVIQLGRECFLLAIAERLGLKDIIKAFESREGWCPMDGSRGITITDVDSYSVDHSEFTAIDMT